MFGRSAMMFGRSARALSSGSFSFSSGRGVSSYADTMDLMNKLSKIPKVDGDLYAALRVREAIKETIKEEGPKAAPCSVAGSAPGCLLSFSNASKNLELFNKLRDIPNLLEIDLLTTLKVMRVITEAKEAALQKEAAHSSPPEVKPSILSIFVAYLTGWTEGDLYKAYNLIMVLGATALSVMGGTVWFCRCIGLFPPSFSEVKEYYEAKGVQISDNNLRQRRREMMNENEKYKLYFLGEWIINAGKNWITNVAVSAKKFQEEIPKQIAKILISKRPIADSYLPSFEHLSAQDLDLGGLRYLAHL